MANAHVYTGIFSFRFLLKIEQENKEKTNIQIYATFRMCDGEKKKYDNTGITLQHRSIE